MNTVREKGGRINVVILRVLAAVFVDERELSTASCCRSAVHYVCCSRDAGCAGCCYLLTPWNPYRRNSRRRFDHGLVTDLQQPSSRHSAPSDRPTGVGTHCTVQPCTVVAAAAAAVPRERCGWVDGGGAARRESSLSRAYGEMLPAASSIRSRPARQRTLTGINTYQWAAHAPGC